MGVKHNNQLVNRHFHKKWQTRVRCHFNQPAKKFRRRQRRIEKARTLAPRPIKKLRPIVRCPTIKYNTKQRLGRGFTLDELKAAGINKHYARTIGIAVDHRRRNKSMEGLQQNVQRLKEYKSKLIIFPKNSKNPRKSAGSPEELKMATQYEGIIMPIKDTYVADPPRAITDEEKKHSVVRAMSKAWAEAKFKGKREKRAREKAEAAAMAKPRK